MRVVRCSLLVAHCVLFVFGLLLRCITDCGSLSFVCGVLIVVCCFLVRLACYSLFVVCCLLLMVR